MENALTVKDLIESLSKMDPDKIVRVDTDSTKYDGGPSNFVEWVSEQEDQVVIDTFTDPNY